MADNAANESSPTSKDLNYKNWQVKLFLLNSEGAWDDYGCGVFSIINDKSEDNELNSSNYFYIRKSSQLNENLISDEAKANKLKKFAKEDRDECLLYAKIEKECVYEKQNGYIITWVDKNLEEEIAISFWDPIAANETW